MKAIPRCLALILALAWLGNGADARAQTPVYTANATTAVPQSGAVHFLQIFSLGQGPGTYTINTITFSANFTDGTSQKLLLYFYTGVDASPSTANALANATAVGAESGDLSPGAAGNYAFTFTPTPFTITTDSTGTIGVEVFLNATDGTFSSTANGRFTDSAPTLGASPGYVWNDADLNSVFTGAEQTRFGMANANMRIALAGSLVRPMPTLKTYVRSGTTATVTVDSYSGVSYQLQRATSLTAGNWTNVGAAVAGATGSVLTFTDSDSTDPAAFYRVVGGLPTQNANGARNQLGKRTITRD